MRTIGTTHAGYFNDRCITNLPHTHYQVKRAPNVFRFPNSAWFKLTGRINHLLLNLHWYPGNGGCDLLHLLNGIHLGRQAWVSTFETYLPRWGAYGYGHIQGGLRRLAGDSCRQLIALSDAAVNIQTQYLEAYPDVRAAILDKITVIAPPQTPQITAYSAKELATDRIDFTLVGADFFRKGGLEILRATDRLLAQGLPLRLNIVSRLQYGDYASQTGPTDLQEAQRLIAKWPGGIVHHDRLPNAEVLALFRRTHVGLLPTWGDTYGFSVLEAQSAGCPVITTNLRALPEINTDERGWLIPVPLDSWRNARLDTDAQRLAFSQQLTDQLTELMRRIVGDPEGIKSRGQAALAYIRAQHSPQKIAAQLASVYDAALS